MKDSTAINSCLLMTLSWFLPFVSKQPPWYSFTVPLRKADPNSWPQCLRPCTIRFWVCFYHDRYSPKDLTLSEQAMHRCLCASPLLRHLLFPWVRLPPKAGRAGSGQIQLFLIQFWFHNDASLYKMTCSFFSHVSSLLLTKLQFSQNWIS